MVTDLTGLLTAHPYQERLASYLMLALYRSDRQSEALDVHGRIRHQLAEELGIEPGPTMSWLQQAILRSDARLGQVSTTDLDRLDGSLVAPGQPPPPPEPATPPAPEPARAIPAQLPPDVYGFTGRTNELALLDAITGDGQQTAVVISAVSGTAGVGKTTLAVHWAHRVRDRFSDGQLYVNLRGYDPDRPMTVADALCRMLTALGVPSTDIPPDVDSRAARYRTEVAGRRMLIVLDNAASAEQVRPLLPGTASCVVLVTSRDALAGLVAVNGARRVDLDALPSVAAHSLLAQLIGHRVEVEPEAAATLAEQCARLPLALRIAAELAVARPATCLAELTLELADQRRRLDLLEVGRDPHGSVAAVFSWSMRHLSPDAARIFGLLGLHPGTDFDAYAIAAPADTTPQRAQRTLDLLLRAHLVHCAEHGRYGMHDLLRAYASGLANDRPADDSHAARRRLFDYYLATAAAATDFLHPADAHRRPRIPPPRTPTPVLADRLAARAWLDTEQVCLTAITAYTAAHGWPTHTVQLSTTLFRYLTGGDPAVALTVHGHARDVARQTGDAAGEAHACNGLGTACQRLGRPGAAIEHYEQARALFRQVGDQTGEARVANNHGLLEERRRPQTAADHFRESVLLFRRAGDLSGEAGALTNLGRAEQQLGQHRQAADHYRKALALCRQVGDAIGEAIALTDLGIIEQEMGLHDTAAEHHRRALAVFVDAGDQGGEAWARNGLGEAIQAAGHPADAIMHHLAALNIAVRAGARDQQARAHTGLAHAHQSLRDPVLAREHFQRALTLYSDLGMPDADHVHARLDTIATSGRVRSTV